MATRAPDRLTYAESAALQVWATRPGARLNTLGELSASWRKELETMADRLLGLKTRDPRKNHRGDEAEYPVLSNGCYQDRRKHEAFMGAAIERLSIYPGCEPDLEDEFEFRFKPRPVAVSQDVTKLRFRVVNRG